MSQNLLSVKVEERPEVYEIIFKLREWSETGEAFAETLNDFPTLSDKSKGILLNGCASQNLYISLGHKYHSHKFIAKFSPRDNGYKVVINHGSSYTVGQVIKIKNKKE